MKRELRERLQGAPHLVPVPRQAVATLRELQPLTGTGRFVFRGERHHDRPMSENTINAALRAMGFPADEVTGHGFRATARTMLHERLGFDPNVIEAQLARSVRDSLGRTSLKRLRRQTSLKIERWLKRSCATCEGCRTSSNFSERGCEVWADSASCRHIASSYRP